jgi:hypothetical protein
MMVVGWFLQHGRFEMWLKTGVKCGSWLLTVAFSGRVVGRASLSLAERVLLAIYHRHTSTSTYTTA